MNYLQGFFTRLHGGWRLVVWCVGYAARLWVGASYFPLIGCMLWIFGVWPWAVVWSAAVAGGSAGALAWMGYLIGLALYVPTHIKNTFFSCFVFLTERNFTYTVYFQNHLTYGYSSLSKYTVVYSKLSKVQLKLNYYFF